MTRRRIAVDLCTYTQDQTNSASPHCQRRATFTVWSQTSGTTAADGQRVCLAHVGPAAEVIRADGGGNTVVTADYERDGGFTTHTDPNGAT